MTTFSFENFNTAPLLAQVSDIAVRIAENNTSDDKYNVDADERDIDLLDEYLMESVDERDVPAPISLSYDFSNEEREELLSHFKKVFRATMLSYEQEAAR